METLLPVIAVVPKKSRHANRPVGKTIPQSAHHNCNMVIHVLVNILQEACSCDAQDPERNADIVNPLVANSESDATCSVDNFICCVICT